MIDEGDFVILKRDSFMRVVQAKKNGRQIIFDRAKFYLDNIFGKPYGSSFEVDSSSKQLLLRAQEFSLDDVLPETSSGKDNRNLVSANEDNQSLGKDEITALRKDGLTGDEVMTELIKNSATFHQKTKFSQEKWIKKKKKRHMNIYTILKPTTRLIAQLYYNREPQKLCFLRIDTLSQILTMSNIQFNSKVLLVESCQGLVTGAILNRLGDEGCLTQLFTGPNPMKGRNAFDDFGFSKELQKTRMKLFPLNLLHELSVFADCRRTKLIENEVLSTADEPEAKKSKLDVSDDEPRPVDKPLVIKADNLATTEPSTAPCLQPSDKNLTSPAKNVPPQESTKHSTNDNGPSSNTRVDLTPAHESQTVGGGNLPTKRQASSPSREENGDEGSIKDESENVDSSNDVHGDVSNAVPERGLPVFLIERKASKEYIENTKFDTLVIAIKAQPTQLVLRLLRLVKLSCPFVVYHQYKEPLMELFVQLKERGGTVNLKLTETWHREIQVLPERTHPTVMMSGTSGYLLTGITVQQ